MIREEGEKKKEVGETKRREKTPAILKDHTLFQQ